MDLKTYLKWYSHINNGKNVGRIRVGNNYFYKFAA